MSRKADIFSFFKKSLNEKEKSDSPSVPTQTQIDESEPRADQSKTRTLSSSNNLTNELQQVDLSVPDDQNQSDSESDLSDLCEGQGDELLFQLESPQKTDNNSDNFVVEENGVSLMNEDVTEYHTAIDISKVDDISSSPIKQSSQELTENKKDTKNKKNKRTREEYLELLKQNRLLKEAQKEKERQEREAKKEQERQEKEARKEQERQERELKREQEKQERDARKEQEKRERELKRKEEKREREAKKEQERLAKEKKLEEERLAKEKILEKSRISNFFKVSSSNLKAKTESVNIPSASRVIDIESSPISEKTQFSNTSSNKSDFQKAFSAFYVKTGYQLPASLKLGNEDLEKSISSIDQQLSKDSIISDTSDSIQFLKNAKQDFLSNSSSISSHITAIELLKEIEKGKKPEQELLDMLKRIPHKYIKFYENVRPPYTGTFSDKTIIPKNDPFSTSETKYDYSYDSDLDWAEGSDGEAEDLDELDDDDEEDNEEGLDDGEFDGFLDKDSNENATEGGDQNANSNQVFKKKVFLTALIPSVQLHNDVTTNFDEDERAYLKAVSVKLFFPTPIDTHSVIGNPPTQASICGEKENSKRKLNADDAQDNASNASNAVNTSQKEKSKSPSKEPKTKKLKPQPPIISELKDLVNILREVEGSSFTIGTLAEVAKVKTETKYSKKMIKDTIQHYAKKDSGTQKWKLINPSEFASLQQKLVSSDSATWIKSQVSDSTVGSQKEDEIQ
ncbi:hypothetical protein ACO0QE_002905 [Hanseniaspora vineae]